MNDKKKDSLIQEGQQLARTDSPTVLVPSSTGDAVHYSNVLQGKPINAYITSSSKKLEKDRITGVNKIQSEGVTISFAEQFLSNVINPSTFKVLIILLTKATIQLPGREAVTDELINNGRKIRISVREFQEACGLKDIKTAREQLNKAIRALSAINFEWTETDGKSKRLCSMPLAGFVVTEETKVIQNGAAEFWINFDMAKYLCNSYIMPYNPALLTINTHLNPASLPIGWKLTALHNMNQDKPSSEKTTVKTLLKAAENSIPRYEDIAAIGGIYERIIKPFHRDMEALVAAGILETFDYFDSNWCLVLPDKLKSLSFKEFQALNIQYVMKDYPAISPRQIEKRRRLREARNKQSKKKNTQEEA